MILSDGSPSTLERWREIAAAMSGGTDNAATAFLDQKIETATMGKQEPVLAPESQMMYALLVMFKRGVEL